MKIKGLAFPYPILGLSDDISATYEAELQSQEIKEDALDFIYEHKLSQDSSVMGLISEGAALFCIEVQCRRTFFRGVFTTQKSSQRITIPIKYLHGDIEIQVFVVAAKSIDSYAPSDAHPDYKDISFKIKKGDVLAYAGTDKIIIERSGYDKASMISVDEGEDESGPFKISLEGDGILILLPKDQYKRFQLIRTSQQIPFIDRQISLSALCEAVRIIVQSKKSTERESENCSGAQWFQVISKIIEDRYPNRRIEVDDVNIIAQELLENPLALSIKLIEDLN